MRLRTFAVSALAVLVLLELPGLISPGRAEADVGFRDFNYSGVSAPTSRKPQSKLWVVEGTWFGSLYNKLTGDHEIHRLDSTANAWRSIGVVIDERRTSFADTLWDGGHLYVASAGSSPTSRGDSARIIRYSYHGGSKTFTLDPGFPMTVTEGGMEAVVIAKDTTGKLWITYTRDDEVLVSHSTSNDRTWRAPYVLPVGGSSNLKSDDLSAIVGYNAKIGVMWSNQNDSAMYFAYHRDGDSDSKWTARTAVKSPGYADDHINLKALTDDPSGQVFAATKTSLNDANGRPTAPLILLLVLDANENWQQHTFSTVGEGHTRPMVLLDPERRQLYQFASAPCCSGGAIYYKQTSLDGISFAPGLGTPFMQSSIDMNINNVTSTKQAVSRGTGLVAIAGDDHTHNYWHNLIVDAPPAPSALPLDRTKPVIRGLSVKPRAFRAQKLGGAAAGSRTGTTIRYRLSEDAAVEFRVDRASLGRRVGRGCVRPTRRNRARRPCTRYRRLRGGFAVQGRQGRNRFRFAGRLNGRRLRSRRHRLVAVPRDATRNRGKAAWARFRILPANRAR
jgi:hypothetical protein